MAQNNEEFLFIPSLAVERRYKEQVKNLLEYNGSKSKIIDMGRLPEVYKALGIKDKELKTNGKTIFKALGFEGHNKHNVSKEIFLQFMKNIILNAFSERLITNKRYFT